MPNASMCSLYLFIYVCLICLSLTYSITLSLTHTHTAIGEHYLSAASFPSSSSSSPVLPSHPPLPPDHLRSGQRQEESAHTEALLQRAREEQERALQLQQEVSLH